MRVVHICNLPLSEDHPDFGRLILHPGKWVLNLARAQKQHTDIQPELITQVSGATRDYSTSIDGVPVHYLAAPSRFRAATFFFFDVRRIKKQIRLLEPDFVHAHGTEDAYSAATQRVGKPSVITLQGCFFLINRRVHLPYWSRERAIEFMEARTLRRAHDVIAKSDYIANAAEKYFPHLRIHHIPNTFDTRILDIPWQEKREPYAIAFVGTITERKGFHLLRHALGLLNAELRPKIILHVLGNNPENPASYEVQELAVLRNLLGERLILHGILPNLDAVKKVAHCKALVAPSLEEMFGNQVIESLLVGTKVIVSSNTAMAENVKRFGSGEIFLNGNAESLVKAIEQTLLYPLKREDAQKVIDRIIENCGPKSVALAHRALYTKIIEAK